MSFPRESDWIQPWEWNLPLELVTIAFIIVIVGGIWAWTRSGKDRRNLPDILGRNVEDFAGVTQEGNGPIPIFLFLLYAFVALVIILYPTITMIFNYNY